MALQRFAPVVEDLAGVPILPAVSHHTLFFDMAGWHTDTGHSVPSVKVVAYLDALGKHNGALRVIPGSHRIDERVLTDLPHGCTGPRSTTRPASGKRPGKSQHM
ncbi:MAG TPA: phytanoyl-CoA dioxygenase family protein [Pseudonocardiaceae bacterium]|nr:phytanoyl-CoA dioxygenase family protein [Pseudonocardiaceae bacterium]